MADKNPEPEESDHEDCKVWWELAYGYARKRGAMVPSIYARCVSDNLYAVWMEHCGARIAHCVTACCTTRAKAEFVDTYLIMSETEPIESSVSLLVPAAKTFVRRQTPRHFK